MSPANQSHNGPQRRTKPHKEAKTSPHVQAAISSLQSFWVPLALTVSLLVFSFIPRVHEHTTLKWSFWGAAAVLLTLQSMLLLRIKNTQSQGVSVIRTLQIVLRPQHYVQAAVQLSVYIYWGYHWPPVYDHAVLILAQLVFAYAFDILLSWSRRDNYVLGFGAFPIVFSTNLFLWFKDDWFYLQFLMIAVGFMGKEFVRWQRDGKNTHIFNPSAFTLGLFSIILLATNTSDLTWGQQIASTLTLAPHIYWFLFAVGLVVMYFFSITLVAGMAAATLFILSALHSAITGVPYFLDSEIPAAVFLGLHLLVTDPSTSPRTPLGKAIFGALYGLGVFGLYALLSALGAPTFYDKLLCVPLLNLSVIGIDRFVQSVRSKGFWSQGRTLWPPLSANPTHMVVWIAFFLVMTAAGKTDGKHTGDSLPFWEQACKQNNRNACDRLLQLKSTYCNDNSAWACNELGVHYSEGVIVAIDTRRALTYFSKACELRLQASCISVLHTQTVNRVEPRAFDLRLLLREGGKNLMDMSEPD
ncbi:MAG: hypothetical protein H7Y02_05975, partial [Candidatus Obscuribacterales bacterium]|nr:hypothetical protein [Steroidobacteraceae bacterium]